MVIVRHRRQIYLVNLVKDERLPIEVRDEVYNALESMIPEFDDIVDIDN